jgi:hypothetical protein
MKTPEQNKAFKEKLLLGLEIAYERLIEFKKYKKTPIVLMRNGQIVWENPK